MSDDSARLQQAARHAQAKRSKTRKSNSAAQGKSTAIALCLAVTVLGIAMVYVSPPKAVAERDINDAALIETVNRDAKVWKAAAQPTFEGWTNGQFIDSGSVSWRNPDGQWHLCPPGPAATEEIPDDFDVRTEWPDCFTGHVYEEGECASSYATAPVDMVANRFCIQDPEGMKGLQLSPQSVVSCDREQSGCSGGGMDTVWGFLEREGVVSEMCFPTTGKEMACDEACTEEEAKKIVLKCIVQGAEAVKREVMTHGPVVAPLRVSDELLVYKSGVFTPTRTAVQLTEKRQQKQPKNQLVKIMGWGVEDEQEYWLVQNSWGAEWGEQGFAKIALQPESEGTQAILGVDFTFSAYPSNMKMQGQPAPEDFEDLELDDDEDDAEDGDIFADIDLEDDEELED